MTFEEAKLIRDNLTDTTNEASELLNNLVKLHRNSLGLVLDNFKETLEYKLAKKNFDIAFRQQRDFNRLFIKQFKKELANERKNKYK